MFILSQNENEFRTSLFHQLLLSEYYYKEQIGNNKSLVRVIGDIMPNPFFDMKDLNDERD
jgi:hypothetical protein